MLTTFPNNVIGCACPRQARNGHHYLKTSLYQGLGPLPNLADQEWDGRLYSRSRETDLSRFRSVEEAVAEDPVYPYKQAKPDSRYAIMMFDKLVRQLCEQYLRGYFVNHHHCARRSPVQNAHYQQDSCLRPWVVLILPWLLASLCGSVVPTKFANGIIYRARCNHIHSRCRYKRPYSPSSS